MTDWVAQAHDVERLADLPPQQFAASVWLSLGFTRAEVGRLLGVVVGAADQYRQLVMRRTGETSTAGLVRRAIREGVITAEPGELERRARTWLDGGLGARAWLEMEVRWLRERLTQPAAPRGIDEQPST